MSQRRETSPQTTHVPDMAPRSTSSKPRRDPLAPVQPEV